MHPEARAFVRSALRGAGPWSKVVEIGGRNINGGVRDLVELVPVGEYLSVDLEDGPAVDVVADCRTWAPPWAADLVLCLEVLEHAEDAVAVVAAAVNYLAPGGRLILTCAGPGRAPHSGHDGGTPRPEEHYANIEPSLLKGWLYDLEDVSVVYDPGPCDVYATGVKPCG